MTNTLTNVIEVLESKGFMVEYDKTNTVLEIESPNGAYEDITPKFIRNEKIEDDFIISDFIDEDTRNICFDFYGYTLNFPTSKELINEIEKSFK